LRGFAGILDLKEKPAMSVELEGVDIIRELSFETVFRGGTSIGKFNSVYATLYRIVFRAKAKTAKLTISDWISKDKPGGRDNQELACNYVLILPYYRQE